MTSPRPERLKPERRPIRLVQASSFDETSVTWLWQDRIPNGKVTILEGDPDLGKSMVTCDLVARTSVGMPFPKRRGGRRPRNVLMVLAEDDWRDTVVPRLRVAGADLSRVHSHELERDAEGNVVPLTFPEDLAEIRRLVKKSRIRLMVIDPVTAFLSETINSHNDASVRRAMTPLAELAQETGCAVLLIRHLNKSGEGKALYRGGGSIAFSGAARSVMVITRHPDDPQNLRVLAMVKGNLTRNERRSLTYQVIPSPDDPDQPVVEWGDFCDLTADDLMGGADSRREAPILKEALEFLRDLLSDGPMSAKDVRKHADSAGLTWGTVKRAKKELRVQSVNVRDEKHIAAWVWKLSEISVHIELES